MGARTLVICPMEIELAAVRRAARAARTAGAPHLELHRSGIGKEAIVACLRRAVERPAPGLPPVGVVLLAGACGALRHVEDVPPIARVIDEHGNEWRSGVGMVAEGCTLIAVDRIVGTPAEKVALARGSGADIVDMESHAFAAACVELRVRWGVVRGVSDTPEETLPGEVLSWIRPDGRTRTVRAAWDLLRRPGLIPHTARVLRRSRRVLPLVGRRVVDVAGGAEAGAAVRPTSR